MVQIAEAGAREPLIRAIAVQLVRRHQPWQHRRRLESLCRFVASLPYYREEIERFQAPTLTLTQGGDCDDHVIALIALGWTLRYPGQPIEVDCDAEGWPGHYQTALGWPEADFIEGSDATHWELCETILPASRRDGFGAATHELLRRYP